jgi:hypothetical protein
MNKRSVAAFALLAFGFAGSAEAQMNIGPPPMPRATVCFHVPCMNQYTGQWETTDLWYNPGHPVVCPEPNLPRCAALPYYQAPQFNFRFDFGRDRDDRWHRGWYYRRW